MVETLPTAKAGFGSGTSPVLAGDAVILARDDKDPRMMALDRATGKTLWEQGLGGTGGIFAGHATPVVWKDQILLHRPSEVAAYDLKSGEKKWWVKVASQGTGTPVVHGDMLFVGAWGSDPDLRDPVPALG